MRIPKLVVSGSPSQGWPPLDEVATGERLELAGLRVVARPNEAVRGKGHGDGHGGECGQAENAGSSFHDSAPWGVVTESLAYIGGNDPNLKSEFHRGRRLKRAGMLADHVLL